MKVRIFTRGASPGFTLIELLVSIAILLVLIVAMSAIVNQTSRIWRYNRSKSEQFRDARLAFEEITRRLSQATLNTYVDMVDSTNQPRVGANATSFVPSRYIRQSELRFISGDAGSVINLPAAAKPHPGDAIFFQAPLGFVNSSNHAELANVLNTWGYFTEYGEDPTIRPSFVNSPRPKRFRLMEMMEPSESMTLYKYTSGVDASNRSKNSSYITTPPLPNANGFTGPVGVTPTSGLTGREWFTDTCFSGAVPNAGSGVNTASPTHVLAANVIAVVLLPKLSPEDDPTGTALAPKYSYDSTSTNSSANINPWNQLPPVMQVTLVAIDEDSAARMSDTGVTNLTSKIGSLFSDSNKFTADLMLPPVGSADSLESYLIGQRIAYRIFTSSVSIKSAKWSRDQKN